MKNIYDSSDGNLTCLKTKLRNTCESYSKTVIDSISRNQSIYILKQMKGRGAVVMDRSKFSEKCLSILETAQFTKLRMIQQSLSQTTYDGH